MSNLLFSAEGSLGRITKGLYETFIKENRYELFLEGFKNTMLLSILASIIGIVIGLTLSYFKLSKNKFLRMIANIYIDIIRGTPVVTQILIIYFVIFASSSINILFIGALAFGINSGAYVSEIVRAGIQSIDKGQTEAGRSLGLNQYQTMRFIIFPQAIKNILPALANEFIVLIKETAIAGYITIVDLTKAATSVASRTYDFFYPLIGTAIIYYLIIKILSSLFGILEKRMRKSDLH